MLTISSFSFFGGPSGACLLLLPMPSLFLLFPSQTPSLKSLLLLAMLISFCIMAWTSFIDRERPSQTSYVSNAKRCKEYCVIDALSFSALKKRDRDPISNLPSLDYSIRQRFFWIGKASLLT